MMDKSCITCGKNSISKNEIGINEKLLGSNIKKIYCIDCLADYLEVTVEELLDKIEEFKEQGCTLFE